MGHEHTQDDLTGLIKSAQRGDADAEQQFFELVNNELRQLASQQVRRFGAAGVEQPTSLVNELFLKLFRDNVVSDLKNRRYFFVVAVDQMRQLLRDQNRKRKSQKRGGHMNRMPLEIALDQHLDDFEDRYKFDFEALEIALNRLQQDANSQRQYEVVKLRFLGGMTVKQTAETLGISERQVAIDWKLARAKLYVELKGDKL